MQPKVLFQDDEKELQNEPAAAVTASQDWKFFSSWEVDPLGIIQGFLEPLMIQEVRPWMKLPDDLPSSLTTAAEEVCNKIMLERSNSSHDDLLQASRRCQLCDINARL